MNASEWQSNKPSDTRTELSLLEFCKLRTEWREILSKML